MAVAVEDVVEAEGIRVVKEVTAVDPVATVVDLEEVDTTAVEVAVDTEAVEVAVDMEEGVAVDLATQGAVGTLTAAGGTEMPSLIASSTNRDLVTVFSAFARLFLIAVISRVSEIN